MSSEERLGCKLNSIAESICSVLHSMFITEPGGGLSVGTTAFAREELIDVLKELSIVVATVDSGDVRK